MNSLYTLPSSRFLPFYIIFLLIGALERISSTFFLNRKTNLNRIIYHKWTFVAPFYTYLIILFISIGYFFINVKVINLIISLFGFFIFMVGMILRRKSIKDLGENWSVYIEIKEGHKLVKDGIYKILKHPYCLAVLFELIGVCLVGNAFSPLILVFLIQLPLLLLRINLEEKVLIDYFGGAYKKYSSEKIL